jgi:hypothetical protein
MKWIRNENGVALVTALMLTLISLGIVMALLLMTTQGTKFSGMNKRYKTALEASYGGTEIFTKDIFPFIMKNYSSPTLSNDVQTAFGGSTVTRVLSDQKCLQSKLTKSTADWPVGCSNTPLAKQDPDISFNLAATSGNQFVVYSKIVDTVKGNSDVGGLQLEGSGVAQSSSVLTPQSFPYIYRLEVQGERQNNPTAQANIEVLYAY